MTWTTINHGTYTGVKSSDLPPTPLEGEFAEVAWTNLPSTLDYDWFPAFLERVYHNGMARNPAIPKNLYIQFNLPVWIELIPRPFGISRWIRPGLLHSCSRTEGPVYSSKKLTNQRR